MRDPGQPGPAESRPALRGRSAGKEEPHAGAPPDEEVPRSTAASGPPGGATSRRAALERSPFWSMIAASVGLVVLAALLLSAPSPRVTPVPTGAGTTEVIEATVLRVLEEGTQMQGGEQRPFARLTVRAESGSIEGGTLEIEEQAIAGINQIRRFGAGDRVLVNYTRNPDGTDRAFIAEYVRRPQLLWLAALFAAAIGVVGGFQGLRSLLGMAISFLVILQFIIPHILAGSSPVLVSVIGALLVMIATLYLSHGFNGKTTAALAGTTVALVLTGALGEIFIHWTRITGVGASDEASRLILRLGTTIDPQGLLLGGLIIATLGVLDDVAISQASAVFELHGANPAQSVRELTARGMRIGRDHIAATVNTLFLAYAGGSLPLLLLLATRPEPLATLLNREFIAAEVVAALVGSLGLIAAVPLTTAAAAFAARRGWSTGATPAHHH